MIVLGPGYRDGPRPETTGHLIAFRRRFDACLMEAGHPPAGWIGFNLNTGLLIQGPHGVGREWDKAAWKALHLTAPTFPPAAHLLAVIQENGVLGSLSMGGRCSPR